MNDAEFSFDDLLCHSLSLFRQFRLYDDCIACEESAVKLLREAEQIISKCGDDVCTAKWGCVIECLAHKYYIHSKTDGILANADAALIKSFKGLKKSLADDFFVSLWIGEYFLLRLKNEQSRNRSRSKDMVSKVLTFMADMVNKPEKQWEPNSFSAELFNETFNWVKEICDMQICEKRIVVLLEKLYLMQQTGRVMSEVETSDKKTLLRYIWDFYY